MKRILIVLLVPAFSGCGILVPQLKTEARLSELSPGQTREEVIDKIGSPNVVRGGSMKGKDKIQIDEYALHKRSEAAINFLVGLGTLTATWWIPLPLARDYALQYRNGKLESWGKAREYASSELERHEVHVIKENP